MLDLDACWRRHTEPHGLYEDRPDFRFDPVHYARLYPDLSEGGWDLRKHFRSHGKKEGRDCTLFDQLKRRSPRLEVLVADLLTDPELKQAVLSGQEEAAQLAFELMVLPVGLDESISDFSARHYEMQYPDTKAAGGPALAHYLQFGIREKRTTLRSIRRNCHKGDREYDPTKKTIILTVHEFTKTGAPMVAHQLLQEASETHNVIVLSLVTGQLLERFRRDSVFVFTTVTPHEEIDFALGAYLPDVEYALLNSTDSSPFVKMLVARSIPFGVYIHEFTQYSLPLHKTIYPTLYADFVIFSSETVRNSWRGTHEDLGFDTDRCSTVIPQADLHPGRVGKTRYQNARDNISEILGIELGDRKLVYGAGSTHWRKGTDLFITMAQIGHSLDEDAVWVWIGDGMNHEDFHCGVWMEKQMVEANVNQKDGFFHYLPSGPYYRDLCIASDVMILPSRMDPLPNVIFDAVKYDCEAVMFTKASGFDDAFYDDEPRFHRVGFGRVDLAAKAAVELPRKLEKSAERDVSEPDENAPSLFSRIEEALEGHLAKQDNFVIGEGDYDLPVLFTEREEDAQLRIIERQKVWSLGRHTVWKSADEARRALKSSGHPVHASSRIVPYAELDSTTDVPDFSIHIHAFYTDDLFNDVTSYGLYERANRIVITTDMMRKANAINGIMKEIGVEAEVHVIDNTGRDILPFMRLFHDIEAFGGDDIWAHVHQKKSLSSTPGGDVWRNFLLKNLFGGKDVMSNALKQMDDPEVGLVAPFDPFVCGWFGSKRILPIYQQLIETEFPVHPTAFPVGNMFFTRRAVVDQMNSYFGEKYPWPNEPIANDGTVFHMIERLWPVATYESGLKSVFLNKDDQPRR